MSKHASRAVRRAPVLLVVAGALVAGGLIDRSGAPRAVPAMSAQAVQPVPVAAPVDAYSSSWFCAGATDTGPNYAAGQVVVANNGPAPVTGSVTIVATSGASAATSVLVAPHTSASVPETVAAGSDWTGAIVDVDGGSVVVTQVLDGALGRSSTPCATSGSRLWYLPTGQTRINATETILLLNPYPTDSIVDLSFSTDQGLEQPQDFQSLDVPPNGLVAVPLGLHLRRRAAIATDVSARTGNVVAWEAEIITPPAKGAVLAGTAAAASPLADPAAPDPGVAVFLGAPSAGTTWVWPDGMAGGGLGEQYVVYNPGVRTADVRLSVGLAHGSAEPFNITVGPHQAVPVVAEQQVRIPAGASHTATLVSTNGVPVVAGRLVGASQANVAGTTRTGLGAMLGERLAAPIWLVPPVPTDQSHAGQVIVENPNSRPVRASLAGGSALVIGPGGRAAVPVTSSGGPSIVTASGPVYVEYDVYGLGGTPGYSISSAVPLA